MYEMKYELAIEKKYEYSSMEKFWIKFSKWTGKKLYIIHYRHFAKTGPDWFRKYCIDDYKGVYPFKSFAKSISREMNKEGYFNTVEVFDHDKEYVDCLYRPVTK
jgi:hypothetical protein